MDAEYLVEDDGSHLALIMESRSGRSGTHPRFVAFYGCMYYAMMRPSEVGALTRSRCYLPDQGWGHLTFADASPVPGKAYTDDGRAHEHRGLKGRTRGRPSRDPRARKPTRRVPIPPEPVALLRAHLEQFGTGPDGRLFRSENGNPIQQSAWWQVWQKVRKLALTPDQLATPLLRRPTTSAIRASPGGSTPACRRPRSRHGRATASRC